jgi:SDR family mycofactocin-dependent oxidoreductase
MRRFEGKTALITGAAHGQGRSHAIGFAREGADVAICDIAEQIGWIPYPLGTGDELEETRRLCEAEGARVIVERVDVRDYGQVKAFVDRAAAELGKIDVLVPNAGIFTFGQLHELPDEQFGDMFDINVKGVWHTCKAALPHMIERGYGRIVAIGSSASLIGYPNVGHYCAAKHAVLGMIKSLALEQAANGITANVVCPSGVGTVMIRNEAAYAVVSPDDPTDEGAAEAYKSLNAIPVPWAEPEDITGLVLFLASDEAKYMTGGEVKIDMGLTAS